MRLHYATTPISQAALQPPHLAAATGADASTVEDFRRTARAFISSFLFSRFGCRGRHFASSFAASLPSFDASSSQLRPDEMLSKFQLLLRREPPDEAEIRCEASSVSEPPPPSFFVGIELRCHQQLISAGCAAERSLPMMLSFISFSSAIFVPPLSQIAPLSSARYFLSPAEGQRRRGALLTTFQPFR